MYVLTTDYLLEMKVLAACADTEDVSDIEFLLKELKSNERTQIAEIVRKYYPNKTIKPETEFLLEEILKKLNTLKATKEKIEAAPKHRRFWLMDFVDDFRYYKNAEIIAESLELSDDKIDALLASTVENLCDELNIEMPEWLSKVPSCDEPFFCFRN